MKIQTDWKLPASFPRVYHVGGDRLKRTTLDQYPEQENGLLVLGITLYFRPYNKFV